MEWVLRSPQIHSTFSNLGVIHANGYHVNENCNAALETILYNILTEDKYLRTYRRSISFGQNIKKDLIPLLIHAKEDVTVELLIKILMNLTIPIECLMSLDVIARHDFGRHTIFEINNLLRSIKSAFTDHQAIKVIMDFLKKNLDFQQNTKLSPEQCTNICNSLCLLRNILHIPEEQGGPHCGQQSRHSPSNNAPHAVQNQIVWNIFSHSVDKVLIKLMSSPDAGKWAVTMVQLIALLYKDQHVATLHKLLNLWLETSSSESSEDNESNTSPPNRGSEDSSPLFTPDATSDSSDTGASGKSNEMSNVESNSWDASSQLNNCSENSNQQQEDKQTSVENTNYDSIKSDNGHTMSCSSGIQSDAKSDQVTNEISDQVTDGISHKVINGISDEVTEGKNDQVTEGKCNEAMPGNNEKKNLISENSDCGYGTQIEHQESISTSSNDDDLPRKKPVHQKPHNPKQRINNNKVRSGSALQDRKRKKITKRAKSNIINVQGLTHKTPTDDDISNVLKEFTVDFLLKGYNSLVQIIHTQILTNMQLEIDTSHFFWLITYFLKFATQIKLDIEHVSSVLSYEIISYLTAEGVNLCEQFELAIKLDGNNLKPNIRRLHLVVTAIREIIQTIETYQKYACKDDQDALLKLQIKICDSEELRNLLVLLLRHYKPKYHTKQYLQDIVVTNHILLMFLDKTIKLPEYNGEASLLDHVRQFASVGVMYQYSSLLEGYVNNGEYVNDCIFTMMHHVGGELDSLITLFQPKVLKTFTSIWKAEFEVCDDWSDLIEYVINTFIKKPHCLLGTTIYDFDPEAFKDDIFSPRGAPIPMKMNVDDMDAKKKSAPNNTGKKSSDKWTAEELSTLSWNFMQCSALPDVMGEIIKMFKEDGIVKSREAVIEALYQLNLINKEEYDRHMKVENDINLKKAQANKIIRDHDIAKLCEQLTQDGNKMFLDWVQKVLLETCSAKIFLEKRYKERGAENAFDNSQTNLRNSDGLDLISPVSYHSLLLNQSVPLVPWNCKQASVCKDLKFLQLLHKLGFHMPVDSGKVFIRIPQFWTADILYDVAGKIAPIDERQLKFSLKDLPKSKITKTMHPGSLPSKALGKDVTIIDSSENYYQVHTQKHLAAMVHYTPMPGTSFSSQAANNHNWLEVVQKSQEYKITMKGSTVVKQTETTQDIIVQLPIKAKEVSVPPVIIPPPVVPCAVYPAAIIVPVPVIANKDDDLHYDVQVAEPDYYNNSVCETASVASDLTRMYVSDEDEKPEVVRPIIKTKTIFDEPMMIDSDDDRI